MNLIKKLFSPVCLTISIILLVYTFSKSIIYWDVTNRDYSIYYLITSVLILFSIITFFIGDKIKTYLIITSISIVFSLYAFEAYLTLKISLNYKQQTRKVCIMVFRRTC